MILGCSFVSVYLSQNDWHEKCTHFKMCAPSFSTAFFSVLIYFNKCVVQLHLRCTQKHVRVHCHVKFCILQLMCAWIQGLLLWWASPYIWYKHSVWESSAVVVFILGVFFGQGCLDAARLTATLSSFSLALRLFKFGLDFPDSRCPFCSVQSSCSPSFHTHVSEVQFDIVHPP